MKEKNKVIVGVSIGDVNGIGPEIVLKTFADARLLDFCTPVIITPEKVLRHYKKLLRLPDLPLHVITSTEQIRKGKVNVLNLEIKDFVIEVGQSTRDGGLVAYEALKLGANLVKEGKLDVLVTAPLNKSNVRDFQSDFIGHTGYLSQIDGQDALMILSSERMRIAMVTGHVAVSDVAKKITTEEIVSKIEALNKSLRFDFGIRKPRIAVLGLNPHAGEEGLMGKEEIDFILPAIDQAKTKGMLVAGPYPSDGFFGSGNYSNFDGVLAMYHDQALIPFKTLSFEDGVNFSAGLSFVRTSPDHGTAYEIAGQGKASESSLRSSIYYACDIFKKRREEIALVQ